MSRPLPADPIPNDKTARQKRLERVVVLAEVLFIFALFVLWFGIPGIRKSKNLWVMFLYNFPSMFLIATVPHEPVFIYFSKFYSPLVVTLVALSGTLATEVVNYHVFGHFKETKPLRKLQEAGLVKKTIALFNKAPFAALWVAAFTPIPFYPFRFLVVLAKYPLSKYLLSLALSRGPRFYLIALVARRIVIPDYVLVLFFAFLVFASYFPLMVKKLKDRRKLAAPSATTGETGG